MRIRRQIVLLVFLWCFVGYYCQGQVLNTHKKPKIGLVLSGGGANGLAHIGVLKVLEEAGIHVDYIGGTSMGSIIGALYALGYRAEDIEKLVVKEDWARLLSDRIPRSSIEFEEREHEGKLFIPFPLQNGALSLPSGLLYGQNLSVLLSRLMWPAISINDFHKFPIPFLCVATDLETGRAVVLDHGCLPDALRASMAIPTIFTPVVIDGKTLVDGGLSDNLPVDDVKAMGADIIIGSNVGFKPYPANKLNSFLKVTEQSMFLRQLDQIVGNQEKCNFLILPDVKDEGVSNFNHAEALIKSGEKAARLMLPRLKALADSLNSIETENIKSLVKDTVVYYNITDLKMEGVDKYSPNFILGKLRLETPSKVNVDMLEDAIMRVYGTNLFEKVSYRFEAIDSINYTLVIRVIERPSKMFSVGVQYNSDFNVSLILNTTFRNILFNGSKLDLEAKLGEYPSFSADYFLSTGWNPKSVNALSHNFIKPDVGIKIEYLNYPLYFYTNDKRTSRYMTDDLSGKLYLRTILQNKYAWELGVENEYTDLKGDINPFSANEDHTFVNFYTRIIRETLNKAAYPTKGSSFYVEAKYVTDLLYGNGNTRFILVTLRFEKIIRLNSRLCLIPGVSGGITFGDSVPLYYKSYLGGLNMNYTHSIFPFVGLQYLEKTDNNAIAAQLNLQYEFYRNNYLIARSNLGQVAFYPENLFLPENLIWGLGLTYGYSSIIGPIELTAMRSNLSGKIMGYLSIGFWL